MIASLSMKQFSQANHGITVSNCACRFVTVTIHPRVCSSWTLPSRHHCQRRFRPRLLCRPTESWQLKMKTAKCTILILSYSVLIVNQHFFLFQAITRSIPVPSTCSMTRNPSVSSQISFQGDLLPGDLLPRLLPRLDPKWVNFQPIQKASLICISDSYCE
jgi:hypothetical protein